MSLDEYERAASTAGYQMLYPDGDVEIVAGLDVEPSEHAALWEIADTLGLTSKRYYPLTRAEADHIARIIAD